MGACYAGAEHRQSKARSVAGSRRAMRSAEQRRQSLAASRATQCACAGRGGVAGCVWRAVRPATCGERRAARADCRSRIAWAQRTGCGRRGAEKTRSRARKATARCACRRRRVKRPGARVITSHGDTSRAGTKCPSKAFAPPCARCCLSAPAMRSLQPQSAPPALRPSRSARELSVLRRCAPRQRCQPAPPRAARAPSGGAGAPKSGSGCVSFGVASPLRPPLRPPRAVRRLAGRRAALPRAARRAAPPASARTTSRWSTAARRRAWRPLSRRRGWWNSSSRRRAAAWTASCAAAPCCPATASARC